MKGPMNAHVQKPTMWQECAQLWTALPLWAPRQPGDSTLAVTERADSFLAQTASQKGIQDLGSCG